MGNHAKRRALAKRMKELGYGKLYSGSKRRAWRFLHGHHCDDQLRWLSFEVGDVFHDCDGFNHVNHGHQLRERDYPRWELGKGSRGWVRYVEHLDKGNGWISCGCGPPDRARTREEIEQFFRGYLYESANSEWTKDDFHNEIRRRLDEGIPFCDDQGVVLPEVWQLRITAFLRVTPRDEIK